MEPASISQRSSPTEPLRIVHLLEVVLEVTGDDAIGSSFLDWEARLNATRGSEWEGFFE